MVTSSAHMPTGEAGTVGVSETFDAATGELTLVGTISRHLKIDLSARSITSLALTIKGLDYQDQNPLSPPILALSLPSNAIGIRIEAVKDAQICFALIAPNARPFVRLFGVGPGRCRVVLQGASPSRLEVSGACVEVEPRTKGHKQTIDSVSLSNAKFTLSGRHVGHLAVYSRSFITINGSYVGQLQFLPGARARVAASASSKVRGLQQVPHIDVGRPAVLLPDSELRVDDLAETSLVISKSSRLTVQNPVRNVQLRGQGAVSLLSGGEQVECGPPAPLLSLAEGAQVLEVSGRVRLGEVSNASLIGSSSGAEGHDESGFVVEAVGDANDLDGVTLINFALPQTVEGMKSLNLLTTKAHVASPSVRGPLPGLKGDTRWSWAFRRVNDPELIVQTHYARALAKLASGKGATGAVRTKLSWAAYRMRNITAEALSERLALSLYRLIGYGERALPPLFLFLVVAALFASASLLDHEVSLSLSGTGVWLDAYGDWIVGPLHVLRRLFELDRARVPCVVTR